MGAELVVGAPLSILAASPNTALICFMLPLPAQTHLIPLKKEEPDGHEEPLRGGDVRVQRCLECLMLFSVCALLARPRR